MATGVKGYLIKIVKFVVICVLIDLVLFHAQTPLDLISHYTEQQLTAWTLESVAWIKYPLFVLAGWLVWNEKI